MYFEELKTGMQVRIKPAVIDRDEMLAFSKRYDDIPIHTDEAYAKQTKFGQPIACGMMSFLVVWAQYLEQDFFGEALLAGKSQKVEWYLPVFAGDTLCGIAEITNLTDRNSRNGIAELTMQVYNQNNDLVLTGVTEAIVKKQCP